MRAERQLWGIDSERVIISTLVPSKLLGRTRVMLYQRTRYGRLEFRRVQLCKFQQSLLARGFLPGIY